MFNNFSIQFVPFRGLKGRKKGMVVKYARWILFNISQMVVKLGHQCPNHPVYNYYLIKKAEGKHYYESLTACSTKILRMLYTMCKNNTTFKIN